MENTDVQDRLAALEDRVRTLEDKLELVRLVSSWGPAVDTGGSDGARAAKALWTDDAVLVSEIARLDGADAIGEMVVGAGQQALIDEGCAHIQGIPVMHIDGDRATATNYSEVYRSGEGSPAVWRVSANHWEFLRTPDGWRVTRRTNHIIDGGPEARGLLRHAYGEGVESEADDR